MSSPAIKASTTSETQHDGDVTSIVLHNDHLYSAGADGKVKIWDLDFNLKREVVVHEAQAYIYSIVVDQKGRMYTSSCDGTIKCVANPLTSDEHSVILEHENEVEAIFIDENSQFYCGDSKGGVTCFENGKFKYTINIVENVKSLYIEKALVYTILNNDLSVHEVKENGKYYMKVSIPGRFPVTLFGDKTDGRSKYLAILTRDGRGITIVKNGLDEKFQTHTVKENLHEMIVNALNGRGDVLFSCDYAGRVMKSQVEGNSLNEIANITTGAGCANCIAVKDENLIFVGNGDGSIKKIAF